MSTPTPAVAEDDHTYPSGRPLDSEGGFGSDPGPTTCIPMPQDSEYTQPEQDIEPLLE